MVVYHLLCSDPCHPGVLCSGLGLAPTGAVLCLTEHIGELLMCLLVYQPVCMSKVIYLIWKKQQLRN